MIGAVWTLMDAGAALETVCGEHNIPMVSIARLRPEIRGLAMFEWPLPSEGDQRIERISFIDKSIQRISLIVNSSESLTKCAALYGAFFLVDRTRYRLKASVTP